MQDLTLLQKHPLQQFTEQEKNSDYSERDNYYIRCLQAVEETMDIDAYILDYCNEQVLYMTRHCSLIKVFKKGVKITFPFSHHLFDKIIPESDLQKVANMNRLVYDFYFNLPMERRFHGAITFDMRMKDENGRYVLINHKVSLLDIAEDGRLRLGLCVINYPTSKIPGKFYIKMSDDSTVYEYIEKSQKFIEVKIQRLTPKSEKVLELASRGRTEKEIADTLGISINTVKYHKRRILRQLNVRNTTEAVQWKNSQKTLIDSL